MINIIVLFGFTTRFSSALMGLFVYTMSLLGERVEIINRDNISANYNCLLQLANMDNIYNSDIVTNFTVEAVAEFAMICELYSANGYNYFITNDGLDDIIETYLSNNIVVEPDNDNIDPDFIEVQINDAILTSNDHRLNADINIINVYASHCSLRLNHLYNMDYYLKEKIYNMISTFNDIDKIKLECELVNMLLLLRNDIHITPSTTTTTTTTTTSTSTSSPIDMSKLLQTKNKQQIDIFKPHSYKRRPTPNYISYSSSE